MNHKIVQFFEYSHLPVHLQEISRPFCEVANFVDSVLPVNAESATALRKLLEAKDAAVRASIFKQYQEEEL